MDGSRLSTAPRPGRIDPTTQATDGALLERLARMRAACHALATELAGTRRQLRAVEAELRALKRREREADRHALVG